MGPEGSHVQLSFPWEMAPTSWARDAGAVRDQRTGDEETKGPLVGSVFPP